MLQMNAADESIFLYCVAYYWECKYISMKYKNTLQTIWVLKPISIHC